MSDLVVMLRDYQRWMKDGLNGAPSIGTEDIDGDETFGKAADALTEQAAEIDRLREEMRQIRGMARHGCDAPNAAYRWCERIDEVILHGAQGEYAEYSMPLPARAALNKEPTQ